MGRLTPLYLCLVLLPGLACSSSFEDGTRAYAAGRYAEAYAIWERLGAEGNATAQYNLGLMHEQGRGVRKDPALAMDWYRRAAQKGRPDAQNNLGVLYATGPKWLRSPVKAYIWLTLAMAQGYQAASANRKLVADGLTPEQRAEAKKQLWNYFREFVEPYQGRPSAQ